MTNPHEAWQKNWRNRRDKGMTDDLVEDATDMSKDVIHVQLLPCRQCGEHIASLPGHPPVNCSEHQ